MNIIPQKIHHTMVSQVFQLSSNPTIECTLLKVAAAVYSITDMVVFHVYKKISEEKYYLVCVLQEDDIKETVNIFEWDKIPKSVMDIYTYVSSTSVIEVNDDMHILYGNHIGRKKDHKYILMKYIEDPCQQDKLHLITLDTDVDENVMFCYNEICENMKIVKNLV